MSKIIADDYGMAPEIDQAILNLKKNKLHKISVMPNQAISLFLQKLDQTWICKPAQKNVAPLRSWPHHGSQTQPRKYSVLSQPGDHAAGTQRRLQSIIQKSD